MQKDVRPAFSFEHNFSQAAIAEAVGVVAEEHRGKRLLMNVTIGHRALALRQSTITMILGALTMLSLYMSERVVSTVDAQSVNLWAIATVINIVSRAALNIWLFSASTPSAVANSLAMRLCPVFIALLAALQWMWSIELFVGQHLGLPTFILFTGLVGTSVSMMGMWPSVPIAAASYLMAAWPPFFYRLYQADWLPEKVLMSIGLGVALMLWGCVYLQMTQVQAILDRSDQVDLLVADLHGSNRELTTANNELDAMRAAAASELEARSWFFSGASHDFKQRLHAMKLLANSAINASDDHAASATSLRRVADAVEEVEQYITNVLDFARFDGTSVQPERTRLQVQRLFQRLELAFEDIAAASSVEIFFKPTDLTLFTDASMLQRMLENLISNAIKFSAHRVVVAARPRDGGWAIEVRDSGPGISEVEQQVIFIPFRQAAQSAKRASGVGLGLAVVKRFAACLGYQIAIRSKPGSGAVLALLIPGKDVVLPDVNPNG